MSNVIFTLFDENGNPVRCLMCEMAQPKCIQFGVLCKDCIRDQNALWGVLRTQGKLAEQRNNNSFGRLK